MKKIPQLFYHLAFIAIAIIVLSAYFPAGYNSPEISAFPYKKAGLTTRQAAAHLLGRFTFGAKPGDVDAAATMGVEKWFQQQLDGGLSDDSLNTKLAGYETLGLTNTEITDRFPRPAQVLRMAIRDGSINKDSLDKSDKKEYRDKLEAYMAKNGMKPQKELFREFFNNKILRAAYTNNQLREVLTDFWFNHFNVSMTKNDCAEFIPAYERDVIRPNVLGKFENLLLATAKSPAMLLYLDNFNSSAANSMEPRRAQMQQQAATGMADVPTDSASVKTVLINKLQKAKAAQGLNENYAREVMELHTLGVDGGYTQQDVTQAARVLTGWTVYPIGESSFGNPLRKLIERVGEDKLADRGYVHEGDFLFAMNRHDQLEKQVLGKMFPANGGYEEGVQLLKMLANSRATATFISRKLAVRFVSDLPPAGLVDKMAKKYLQSGGDIRQVLVTMVESPEFWSTASVREKTKSPFELAISAVRSLNAEIDEPAQLYNWIAKMAQKMYFYQAPTGFPDKGQYWINTGALLNRMNFGLALAAQRIPGIRFNLIALNNQHEPESAEAALVSFGNLMMPERNLAETVKRLSPLLNDPELEQKVDAAAGKTPAAVSQGSMASNNELMLPDANPGKTRPEKIGKNGLTRGKNAGLQTLPGNTSMLSQVVGIIIGSPEFQRR